MTTSTHEPLSTATVNLLCDADARATSSIVEEGARDATIVTTFAVTMPPSCFEAYAYQDYVSKGTWSAHCPACGYISPHALRSDAWDAALDHIEEA